jgi:hypothetical protein
MENQNSEELVYAASSGDIKQVEESISKGVMRWIFFHVCYINKDFFN